MNKRQKVSHDSIICALSSCNDKSQTYSSLSCNDTSPISSSLSCNDTSPISSLLLRDEPPHFSSQLRDDIPHPWKNCLYFEPGLLRTIDKYDNGFLQEYCLHWYFALGLEPLSPNVIECVARIEDLSVLQKVISQCVHHKDFECMIYLSLEACAHSGRLPQVKFLWSFVDIADLEDEEYWYGVCQRSVMRASTNGYMNIVYFILEQFESHTRRKVNLIDFTLID